MRTTTKKASRNFTRSEFTEISIEITGSVELFFDSVRMFPRVEKELTLGRIRDEVQLEKEMRRDQREIERLVQMEIYDKYSRFPGFRLIEINQVIPIVEEIDPLSGSITANFVGAYRGNY